MLFSLPRLRPSDFPNDPYKDVAACWWGLERFIAHAMALYDEHYKLLYDNRMVASIKRETFLEYLRAEAGTADFKTGRNAHTSMPDLMKATGMSESTMHRGRQLLYKFGCRTVVYRGRQLTKMESLIRWNRDLPKIQGWTAVAALHESRDFPVDNSLVQTLLDQGIGTPPERSEGFSFLSRGEVVSSTKNAMKGCASRGPEKERRAKRHRVYDQKAMLLASGVRRDERFPLWVRQISPGRLAAVLTRKARAEWDVDDVFGGLEEWRIAGKTLLTAPDSPPGYLWKVLDELPDDMPPARYDRARTVQFEEAERKHREQLREEARASAMAKADENSPGRQAAMAENHRNRQNSTSSTVARNRAIERARQELAQRSRNVPPTD
ncbi:hypothetical protein [Nocardia tengchongensis]|uniref:hypothetical protein n=1 Tax=Nocardia tengchongensis TaxID=2055889 RepID=UPI0036765672